MILEAMYLIGRKTSEMCTEIEKQNTYIIVNWSLKQIYFEHDNSLEGSKKYIYIKIIIITPWKNYFSFVIYKK